MWWEKRGTLWYVFLGGKRKAPADKVIRMRNAKPKPNIPYQLTQYFKLYWINLVKYVSNTANGTQNDADLCANEEYHFFKTTAFLNSRKINRYMISNFGFVFLKPTQWDPRNFRQMCFSRVDNSLTIEAKNVNMPIWGQWEQSNVTSVNVNLSCLTY